MKTRASFSVLLAAAILGCTAGHSAAAANVSAQAASHAVAALAPQPGQVAYADFSCYAGLPMTIKDTSVFFGHLVLNPGCNIMLAPEIHNAVPPANVAITFNSLELHGVTTLHVEHDQEAANSAGGVPPEPKQANGETVNGQDGAQGYRGDDGQASLGLTLTIGHFDAASNGSLWIRTDGQGGGAGGKGGKGAKGSAGPFSGTNCPNGGDGGKGGKGGAGGNGADTTRVALTIAGVMMPAESAKARGVMPAAVVPGTNNVVVASGAPGAGGAAGAGGDGGDPGEGHPDKCSLFTGHADQGNGGVTGDAGAVGSTGRVIK